MLPFYRKIKHEGVSDNHLQLIQFSLLLHSSVFQFLCSYVKGHQAAPSTQKPAPKNSFDKWYEQDLIDWMDWQLEVNGMSAAVVARNLNSRGITGKRGGKWQEQSV